MALQTWKRHLVKINIGKDDLCRPFCHPLLNKMIFFLKRSQRLFTEMTVSQNALSF